MDLSWDMIVPPVGPKRIRKRKMVKKVKLGKGSGSRTKPVQNKKFTKLTGATKANKHQIGAWDVASGLTGNIFSSRSSGKKVKKKYPKQISVGSTCSGAGTMEFSLRDLDVKYISRFACDKSPAAQKFFKAHHDTNFFLEDALDECHEHAPFVHAYSCLLYTSPSPRDS